MTWRIFIVIALLAIAGLSVLARRERTGQLSGADSAQQEPLQPGYFMNEARIVQTGADGLPVYRVDAARIRQNPKDLNIRLEDLHVDYSTGTDPQSWTLTARTGVMPQSATQIELQDDVEIKGRPPIGGGSPQLATIRTSKLSVDLQAQVAHTRERVDILWGNRQLSAVGMTADLKNERLKLQSSIHGQFIR